VLCRGRSAGHLCMLSTRHNVAIPSGGRSEGSMGAAARPFPVT
jgi:hypothetical protein